LPHFIELSPEFHEKEEWDLNIFFGLLKYHFVWSDITYDEPILDILDTTVNFEDKMGKHMLKVNFPALEYWKINAHQ
jgi:hypothetical protein